MKPVNAHRRGRRRDRRGVAPAGRAPGNALLEFVLTLPIIVFVAGLTIVMSMAMLSKQQALLVARYHLYQAAGNGWWTQMKLEGWDASLSNPGAGGQNMPRGYGAELDRLYPEVAPRSLASTSNAEARDYWQRIWDNLPGRHETHASRTFKRAKMWEFIEPTASADHLRDSSPWHYHHLDAWKIARSGPLREIFDAFYNNLQATVAPHFDPTRKDIIDRWWHGRDILDDEDSRATAQTVGG
ncbi:MAG: pilus assembly protein [Planctomycetes bacterium]|nr:pilus assembly protein [Planctomycetota bacterium]